MTKNIAVCIVNVKQTLQHICCQGKARITIVLNMYVFSLLLGLAANNGYGLIPMNMHPLYMDVKQEQVILYFDKFANIALQ